MGQIRILRLDKTGYPREWLNYEQAATLFARELVTWTLGEEVATLYGGYNRLTNQQSKITLNSIIACDGPIKRIKPYKPCLTNKALFARDHYTCMYCGIEGGYQDLTRDHIVPSSRGGKDLWSNCVTACRRCNHRKGHFILNEIGMELLAVPYVPNHAEYLAMINSRRILADQMDFLKTQFSSNWKKM